MLNHWINSKSIKVRMATAIVSNSCRAGISFIAGLLIARGLGPSGYGNFRFLLSSCVTICTLLDFGVANGFFTFISQQSDNFKIYRFYYLWLTVQFVFIALLIGTLLPGFLVTKFWLGHSRSIIILAFVASFLQQQAWQALISRLGEAARYTVKVQILNICIALSYFIVVLILLFVHNITLHSMLWLIIVQYVVFFLISLWYMQLWGKFACIKNVQVDSATVKRYWNYCYPLAVFNIVSFLYGFGETWFLQRLSGATQQGYYQIAYQFAAISLLATTSILSVFWREIAEAVALKDTAKIGRLYNGVNKSLVFAGAMLSGFLIPWSKELIITLLGSPYLASWPVLFVLFLYPIHQSMGQVGATMFIASEKNRLYAKISILFMLASIPITYFLLAPPTGCFLSGFGLGALGYAIKMVVLNIISVNILAWFVANYFKFPYEWKFQVYSVVSTLVLGYFAKGIIGYFWDIRGNVFIATILPMLFSAGIYFFLVGWLLWYFPTLIGLDRARLKNFITKAMKRTRIL
jgi:O-antigen/teichoic acid export membrane protein